LGEWLGNVALLFWKKDRSGSFGGGNTSVALMSSSWTFFCFLFGELLAAPFARPAQALNTICFVLMGDLRATYGIRVSTPTMIDWEEATTTATTATRSIGIDRYSLSRLPQAHKKIIFPP
jgi:hypothetical protein